jgi:UDP-N-acetyl-D-glucosamine/UDP-N-acetyl-D-galactosamine dehydrogenase
MGRFIASKLIKLLVKAGKPVNGARVGVLGLTFKENVPDLRNSKVPDIIKELKEFGIEPLVHDPMASADGARHEYGLGLSPLSEFENLDAIVLAVSHREYVDALPALLKRLSPNGIVIDIKSIVPAEAVPAGATYWSL